MSTARKASDAYPSPSSSSHCGQGHICDYSLLQITNAPPDCSNQVDVNEVPFVRGSIKQGEIGEVNDFFFPITNLGFPAKS